MKYLGRVHGARVSESPPARGRGLKLREVLFIAIAYPSPPTRGRGLKSTYDAIVLCERAVAPYAGAWVEMSLKTLCCSSSRSPPTRGRGLK